MGWEKECQKSKSFSFRFYLKPFRLFLDVAAQMNAKIVNLSKIAQDVDADTKSVQKYFERHPYRNPFEFSRQQFKKAPEKKPKFYYFDTGVTRSLNRRGNLALEKRTSRAWLH
jgi:hypothetical protein